MSRLLKIGLIALIILGIAIVWIIWPLREAQAPIKEIVPVEEQKAETNPILVELAWCESSNRSNIVILDTNGKYSYGLLQFQEATWIYYMEKYNLAPFAERGELMNLIYDDYTQTKLATLILEEKGAWRNWFNCLKRTQLAKGR